jgi:hypothetical protein
MHLYIGQYSLYTVKPLVHSTVLPPPTFLHSASSCDGAKEHAVEERRNMMQVVPLFCLLSELYGRIDSMVGEMKCRQCRQGGVDSIFCNFCNFCEPITLDAADIPPDMPITFRVSDDPKRGTGVTYSPRRDLKASPQGIFIGLGEGVRVVNVHLIRDKGLISSALPPSQFVSTNRGTWWLESGMERGNGLPDVLEGCVSLEKSSLVFVVEKVHGDKWVLTP